jgi:uncharacterized protein (DUF305 family)
VVVKLALKAVLAVRAMVPHPQGAVVLHKAVLAEIVKNAAKEILTVHRQIVSTTVATTETMIATWIVVWTKEMTVAHAATSCHVTLIRS